MGAVAKTFSLADGLSAGSSPEGQVGRSLRGLVERAQAGEARAFDALVVYFERKVVATAWRILGNQADALDAAQEVFIRLHRYLRTFRADQDFSAWLYRLIINACHDTRSRRSKHVSLEGEHSAVAALRSEDDVLATVIARQDQSMIEEALATLSEREKTALVLRDLEGLSTDTVAKILGSTPTTVRSQISSARAKMRLFRDRLARQEADR